MASGVKIACSDSTGTWYAEIVCDQRSFVISGSGDGRFREDREGDRATQVGRASRYRDSSTSVIVVRRDGCDGIAPRAAKRKVRGYDRGSSRKDLGLR